MAHSSFIDDDPPVTGGIAAPSHLMRDDDSDAPTDRLGWTAWFLLKTHADKLALKFRAADLNGMDDATKRQLITDIRSSLGITTVSDSRL